MPTIIDISPINQTYMKIRCEDAGVLMELSEYFTFYVPGYRFMPGFKAKKWDGKLRLYNLYTGRLYVGLLSYIHKFAEERGYLVEFSPEFSSTYKVEKKPISSVDATDFFSQLKLHASDSGKLVEITPYDYQVEAFKHAVNNNRALLLSPTSCHPKGTKVVMNDGSLKNVEDIKIGDVLMGPDNLPRNVLKLNQGEDLVYKINPIFGKPFYVNQNHVLSLVRTNTSNSRKDTLDGKSKYSGSVINLTVSEYLKKSKTFKHEHKLYYGSKELKFNREESTLPIEPYFLGLLLGDGCLCGGVNLTTMDKEVEDEIFKQAKIWNLNIRVECKIPEQRAKSYSYSGLKRNKTRTFNSLWDNIKKLKLSNTRSHNKFIPEIYKFASIQDRYQILAGLLDTDGWKEKNGYNFCTKSEQLNADVAFIARSLGFKVNERKTSIKYNGLRYYELSILGDVTKIPLKIERKKWNILPKKRTNVYRSGFKIEPVSKQQVFGFTLDQDSLYLLDDFLVTHNSGKSAIIYGLIRWYSINPKNRILIIVPTTSLVEQMYKDFSEYSSKDKKWNVETTCHRIYQGKSKHTDKQVVISTWQSLYRMQPQWFEQFSVVIGDEAHLAKADSIKGILEKCTSATYRFGTTGTLDGTKTHRLVLEGLFGKVHKVITTKELMDQGKVADMSINCIVLKYPDVICKLMKEADYQSEIDYLVNNRPRNIFIRNLVLNLKGNSLVLFKLVSHGKTLYELIKEKAGKHRRVFFVSGSTATEEREAIRVIAERETDAIIVASYGTFSTGVSIRNINNVIFSSPSKSRIRNLQSIGRGLRLSATKSKVELYDIADDLKYKKHKNHTLNHFLYRLEIYNQEKFKFQIFKVNLKG